MRCVRCVYWFPIDSSDGIYIYLGSLRDHETLKLIKSISTIGFFTALSRVLGFIRDILIASLLGASPLADAFFAAFKLPNFFRRLFAEGVLSSAFVPLYARLYASEGLARAQRAAEEVFAVLLIILIILVMVFEIFMPTLMKVIAPGFSATPERLEMAVVFARTTFPYILFISLAALISGVLNSHGKFSAASSAPMLLNITMILGLLSSKSYFPSAGHALSFSALVAGILQFLWVFWASHRAAFALRFRKPRLTPLVRKLFRSMIPGAIGAGVVQINLLFDIVIASFLPTGAISYLYYADRLNQLPLSIIGIALSTALLPVLSSHLQQNLHEKAHHTQNRVLEMALILTLPAAVALMTFSEPIMTALFERDAFHHRDVIETARTLTAFASGLPAYVLIKIFSTTFFANYDMRTPAQVGGAALVLNVILNLLLMGPLRHVGIALATAISAWLNAAVLAFFLRKRRQLILDQRFKSRFPRIIFSSLVLGCFLSGIQFYWSYDTPHLLQASILAATIFLGLMMYFLTSLMAGAIVYDDIGSVLKRKRKTSQT